MESLSNLIASEGGLLIALSLIIFAAMQIAVALDRRTRQGRRP
jgi:hypothetical protein